MTKNKTKLKIAGIGIAVLLPTLFGLVCGLLKLVPFNSLDNQVYGAELLPLGLTQVNGLYLLAMALLCSMVIIIGILIGIVLTKRLAARVTKS
ncbi:MAG TPA: hypothetical protein VLH15_06720 [Dehalococcoidales bacterium]|nr:hypothetical protein [Dehalococcoidales bacterium]